MSEWAIGIVTGVVVLSIFSFFFRKTKPEEAEPAEPLPPARFKKGDRVQTVVGGYVGQVLEDRDADGDYDVRYLRGGGGKLRDAYFKDFELESR